MSLEEACAILRCGKKAPVSIRSPPSCSGSSRQDFAVLPPIWLLGVGGVKKSPLGKVLPPCPRQEEGEERKRGRKRMRRGVCTCPSVRRREKCQRVSDEPSQGWAAAAAARNPRYDPRRGQRHRPLRYYCVKGKKTPYFLYIATITERRKYTVGGYHYTKEPIAFPPPR